MIKKEINEIKSLFNIEDCGIHKIACCYVNGEKEKVTKFTETFLNLPEEERHKYFDIFRKTLSGTQGKNLLDMKFNLSAYGEDGAQAMLMELKNTGLEDEKLLDSFYDKIIKSYNYPGNYIIILINQTYDIPGKTTDGIAMEDASDEIYNYILCSICHVTLSKPGLGYNEEENTFHSQRQFHMIDLPDIGFLFPAFNDRSEDRDIVLYYTKDVNNFQTEFISYILDSQIPLPAGSQKETFQTLVTETLGEECDYKTIKNIHENLNEMIQQKKDEPEPAVLDRNSARQLLEKSGVKEEKLEHFEEQFDNAAGESGKLLAANVAEIRKFEVKTPDIVVKINPSKTDLVKTMVIEDKQCLVIEIDERLEVNGISVNPYTGEVIEHE